MSSTPSSHDGHPESRFSSRVRHYVAHRPGYPNEVLALLERHAGLGPQSRVADIGAGTGISAAWLLQTGCTVYAVEPNAAMRGAAEERLAGTRGFHSIAGTAQATGLPGSSVDLVIAAQAFHWFDVALAREEFSRILKPQGRVALMWNDRRLDSTPFLRGYEALLLRYGTDYQLVRHEWINTEVLGGFFKAGVYDTYSFPNEFQMDYPALEGRLLSSSYTPPPGHVDHEPMLAELQRLFHANEVEGKVSFDYDTRLYLGC